MPWRCLALITFLLTSALATADWPNFRGPHGNGSADEKTLPLKWGPKDNIAWKVALPGRGASSPIVFGDRVVVTSFTGTKAAEIVRHVLGFERTTGKQVWRRDYPAPLPENDYVKQVTQHGLATSTPATDGKRLYVFFGRGGLHALDLDGNPLWKADLGERFNVFGSGSSPLVVDDKVIVNAYIESQKLWALDKATGKPLWESVIDGFCWSTPLVVEPVKGKKEIVLNVGAGVYGHDLATGKQLWSADIIATYNGSTPVTKDGIVYVMNQGQGEKEFVAVRAGGKGDVTKSHVLWRQLKAGASYTSPLLLGDRLFCFGGQGYCLQTKDGEIANKISLEGIQSVYGSPILVVDKILLFTRFNGAYVISADDKMQVLAHNKLGDDSAFNASPALVGGQIFMRSDQYLYCIGKK